MSMSSRYSLEDLPIIINLLIIIEYLNRRYSTDLYIRFNYNGLFEYGIFKYNVCDIIDKSNKNRLLKLFIIDDDKLNIYKDTTILL